MEEGEADQATQGWAHDQGLINGFLTDWEGPFSFLGPHQPGLNACSVHSPVSDAEDKNMRKPDSGSQELKVKREILTKFHVPGMVL